MFVSALLIDCFKDIYIFNKKISKGNKPQASSSKQA